MRKCFLTKGLYFFGFLALSLSVANASLIPCTVQNGGIDNPVTASTVVICGGLTLLVHFESQNTTNGAWRSEYRPSGRIGVRFGNGHAAYVSFNPNPKGGANQDEQFLFTVTGGLSQIDLSLGGSDATITERACANPIATAGPLAVLCTDSTPALSMSAAWSNYGRLRRTTTSPLFSVTVPQHFARLPHLQGYRDGCERTVKRVHAELLTRDRRLQSRSACSCWDPDYSAWGCCGGNRSRARTEIQKLQPSP